MQTYNTVSGQPTHYGRRGSNVDSIVFDLEQQERLRQHYERKKKKKAPKIPITDQDIEEWFTEEMKMKKEVEKDKYWE